MEANNKKYRKLLLNESDIDVFPIFDSLMENVNTFMPQRMPTPKGNAFIGMFGKHLINVYWENDTNVLTIKFLDVLGCDTNYIDDKYKIVDILKNEFENQCKPVIVVTENTIQCSFFKEV